MSWTDKKRLQAFFDKQLVPTAERLHGRNVTFFAMGPNDPQPNHPATARDPNAQEPDSWYAAPPAGPQLFTRESEELEQNLKQLWQEQNTPELIPLAAPLAKLATQLERPEQQSSDLSPFVYVLY